MFDCAIIGGGIVGLATAMTLSRRSPQARLLVLEKEDQLACHQTGRNSGVIHSGIYYKPGSYKARFARRGSQSMVEFCREHGLPCDVCGKVIVAVNETELPRLENLHQRGLQNGLEVSRLTPEQVREIEPHVHCLGGLRIPSTGITDYKRVCSKYAELVSQHDNQVMTGARVMRIRPESGGYHLETSKGDFETRFLINCAGLHNDRIVRTAGSQPVAQVVPFRGEDDELVSHRRQLVKNLIYPVPNPDFPFLGVHFTRMIDGSIHAGPNAVLAFKREGYHKTDFSLRDAWETLTYAGFWKLAGKHMGEGWMEFRRSLSKKLFTHALQQLIPEIREEDLIPGHAGVRAQALRPDGGLVDDFLFVEGPNAMHVCNAPSPAATASLEIATEIVAKIPPMPNRTTVATQVAASS